jgi:hypothetical protein
MRVRRLTLRKETLAELSAGELRGVAGGTCPATVDWQACLAQTMTGCPGYYCTGTI